MKQANLVVTFIDFKKAFDSIRWSALASILAAYGIPMQCSDGTLLWS